MNELAQQNSSETSRREFLLFFGYYLLGTTTGAIGATIFDSTKEKKSLPQGYWEGVVIQKGWLQASINAYSMEPDIAIAYVDIMIKDLNNHWRTICRLTIPTATNTYTCNQDISHLIDKTAPVEVSFIVVNTIGKVSNAPDGIRKLLPR